MAIFGLVLWLIVFFIFTAMEKHEVSHKPDVRANFKKFHHMQENNIGTSYDRVKVIMNKK